MNRHYFLHGTLLGLALVPVVACLIMGSAALNFLLPRFLIPIGAGYFVAIRAARFGDSELTANPPGIVRTVLVLVTVFVLGVLSGCLMNAVVNGELAHPPFGFAAELRDWAVKLAFWLLLIGVPCAVLVGLAHFAWNRFRRAGR